MKLMKGLIAVMIMGCLCFGMQSFVWGADVVTVTINASPGANGTFTNPISPTYRNKTGFLNISVYGSTWVANVFLQRSFDGTNYYDVNKSSWTTNCQHALVDKEPKVRYRLGVKQGGFTSGSVTVRLSK